MYRSFQSVANKIDLTWQGGSGKLAEDSTFNIHVHKCNNNANFALNMNVAVECCAGS